MNATGVLLITTCVLVLLLIDRILVVHMLRRECEGYEILLEERDTFAHNQHVANVNLLVKVAPLLEKTDWMTGRWGGKFDQLLALEKKRNEQVQALRSVYFNHPDFATSVSAAPAEFIPTNVDVVL